MASIDRRSALAGLASPIVASVAMAQGKAQPDTPKPQEIPLASAYSSTKEDGPKEIRLGAKEYDRRVVDAIHEATTNHGLSNIFMVRGRDIHDALFSTKTAFTTSAGVDGPLLGNEDRPSDHVWVVAFLGSSGTGRMSFTAVERAGTRNRVSFTFNAVGGPDDLVPYLLWVPVGKLELANYTLELYDAKAKQIVLTRLVRHTT